MGNAGEKPGVEVLEILHRSQKMDELN